MNGIFDYTVQQWGLEQAVRYTQDLMNVCASLAAAPTQAPDCNHIRLNYRRAAVGRHIIYLRIEDYGISVIRILHQRMHALRHL